MFFSISHALERKRKELNQMSANAPLTSEETLHHSKQLDLFINHYQHQKKSNLNVDGSIESSTFILKLKGQLDLNTTELLTDYIETIKHKFKKVSELSIDLGELHFFDTSGIHSLMLLLIEARDHNISINEINTTKTSFEVLNLMGIPDILHKMNCGTIKPN